MNTRYDLDARTGYSGRKSLLIIIVFLSFLAALSSLTAQTGPVWVVQDSRALGQSHASAGGRHPQFGWDSREIGDTVQALSSVPGTRADSMHSYATAGVYVLTHPTRSDVFAWMKVDGKGTDRLRIRWYANAETFSEEPGSAVLQGMVKYLLYLNLGIADGGEDSLDVFFAWSQRMYAHSTRPGNSVYVGHHSLRLDVAGYNRELGLPVRRYNSLYDQYADFPMYLYADSDSLRENRTGTFRVAADDSVLLNTGAFLFSRDPNGQALVYGELVLGLNGPVHTSDIRDWDEDFPSDGQGDGGEGNVSGVRDESGFSGGPRTHAAPNPFSETVRISCVTTAPGDLAFVIANERGEVLRRLHAQVGFSGTAVAEWDGTDDAGHPVPAGIYLYHPVQQSVDGVVRTGNGGLLMFDGR